MSNDRAREEIATALAGASDVIVVGWRERTPMTAEGLLARNSREAIAEHLLPTVRALMAGAAAKALEEAAEDLRQHGVGPEVFVVDDRAAACRARALTARTERETS